MTKNKCPAADLVIVENNQALTTSLKVAEAFDKNHQHVMRDIRGLIEQMASDRHSPKLDFAKMFTETTYQAEEGGRKYPLYLMNRDGFSLLAMGFTGKKALQFKLKFLQAFNQMEAKLADIAAQAELERQKIRRAGIDLGRKRLTAAIHKFNVRDFPDGDRAPQGRKRYPGITKRMQIQSLGIEKGERDYATGAELATLFIGERAAAKILEDEFENGIAYHYAVQQASLAFDSIVEIAKLDDRIDSPKSFKRKHSCQIPLLT